MKTLKKMTESRQIIQRSTFIGYCYPVTSIEEVETILSELHLLHPKRAHLCYAYRIDDLHVHMEDDGEPKNTAGKPIYDVIINQDLKHVLCVVIRYFGGILLGAGPLTRAYRTTTVNTLMNAETVQFYKWNTYVIHMTYEQETIFIKRLGSNTFIIEKIYLETVSIHIATQLNESALKDLLYDAISIQVQPTIWHEKSPV